jgi:RNA polymerase sigma factor (sigma-70 family)
VVVAAAGPSPAAEGALRQLCEKYWFPLYGFVRRRGQTPAEAEDSVQSFLAHFLAEQHLAKADRTRGRFRSYLVMCFENFLHNQWRKATAAKRGGGEEVVTLDTHDAESRYAIEDHSTEPPDLAYNRQWARSLLDQVFAQLRSEWSQGDRPDLFEELQAHLWGDPTSLPYQTLADRFGMTRVNLRVTLHRLRQRYRELLRDAVAQTIADPSEVDDELRFLMQVVSR